MHYPNLSTFLYFHFYHCSINHVHLLLSRFYSAPLLALLPSIPWKAAGEIFKNYKSAPVILFHGFPEHSRWKPNLLLGPTQTTLPALPTHDLISLSPLLSPPQTHWPTSPCLKALLSCCCKCSASMSLHGWDLLVIQIFIQELPPLRSCPWSPLTPKHRQILHSTYPWPWPKSLSMVAPWVFCLLLNLLSLYQHKSFTLPVMDVEISDISIYLMKEWKPQSSKKRHSTQGSAINAELGTATEVLALCWDRSEREMFGFQKTREREVFRRNLLT